MRCATIALSNLELEGCFLGFVCKLVCKRLFRLVVSLYYFATSARGRQRLGMVQRLVGFGLLRLQPNRQSDRSYKWLLSCSSRRRLDPQCEPLPRCESELLRAGRSHLLRGVSCCPAQLEAPLLTGLTLCSLFFCPLCPNETLHL